MTGYEGRLTRVNEGQRADSSFVLRQSSLSDVPALVRLINRAYQVEQFFVQGDRTSDADIRERMARPGAAFLVCADERSLAGAIFVQVRGDRGFFAMLAVDPDHQKEGLGRLLVTAAEDRCRSAGCRFLDIDVVNLRSELPGFYAVLGFAPYDTAPFHEPAKLRREAHLVLMTKPLVPIW